MNTNLKYLPFYLGLMAMLMCQTPLLQAQQVRCYDYDCMIDLARNYIKQEDYKSALNTVLSAQGYPKSDSVRYESEILLQEIFNEIKRQKDDAEQLLKKAILADSIAKMETKVADSLRIKTEAALDSLKAEKARTQYLIDQGMALQATFADDCTAEYLYKSGLQYFQWDKLAQKRDYQNALTYFALVRFLEPSDTLKNLVSAAQTGIDAEQDFLYGKLDSAKIKYERIIEYIRLNIDSIQATSVNAAYENEKIRQIEEVQQLFKDFKSQHRAASDSITLYGNWWTIPQEFSAYHQARIIQFDNNLNNFRQIPKILCQLTRLEQVTFSNCQKLTILKDWECLPRITSLSVINNPNLSALENMDQLKYLKKLTIYDCNALMNVENCKNLTHLTLKSSPLVQLPTLLENNHTLQSLHLADLPQNTIHTGNLPDLQDYQLERMQVKSLIGLEKNTKLSSLNLNGLKQLGIIALPTQLQKINISKCDALFSLENWAPSDNLVNMSLMQNETLQQLPNWSYYPHLKSLLIKDQKLLRSIKGLKQLNELDKLWIINNPNIRTYSLNIGSGFEWGIKFNSLKLEFEYRRKGLFAFRKNKRVMKDQEFGYKFLVTYLRKDIDNELPNLPNNSTGFFAGGMVTYYSPNYVFAGQGIGLGKLPYIFPNSELSQECLRFVWMNNVGVQFAPYFLLKDKMSVTIDLYTFFDNFTTYNIIPTFGITYFHTLGMNKKTVFYRPADARRFLVPSRKAIFHKKQWIKINTLE